MSTNFEVYCFNEQQVNNVAAVGSDAVAQRMADVLVEQNTINVGEGGSNRPVKRCYPY